MDPQPIVERRWPTAASAASRCVARSSCRTTSRENVYDFAIRMVSCAPFNGTAWSSLYNLNHKANIVSLHRYGRVCMYIRRMVSSKVAWHAQSSQLLAVAGCCRLLLYGSEFLLPASFEDCLQRFIQGTVCLSIGRERVRARGRCRTTVLLSLGGTASASGTEPNAWPPSHLAPFSSASSSRGNEAVPCFQPRPCATAFSLPSSSVAQSQTSLDDRRHDHRSDVKRAHADLQLDACKFQPSLTRP